MDSFADVSSAPFRWSVLKKPEVWGGLLGAFALGAFLNRFTPSEDKPKAALSVREMSMPLRAFPVGVGEECLFRGYLQSTLIEALGPVGGIAVASAAFGAAHIPNASGFSKKERLAYYKFGIPFITAAGGYLGWMTYKNRSLQESVAMHAWYDFAIFAAEAATAAAIHTDEEASPATFSITIPF
jgi:membrane protease YdiL (CAAX protease family)